MPATKTAITVCFLIAYLNSVVVIAQTTNLTDDTKILALCEGRYVYAAHLAQMNNNEGLATNLLLRSSRVTATYLFLNEHEGRVRGEIVEQIKLIRRGDKPLLDQDPQKVVFLVSECDSKTQTLIARARNMKKIWDGRTFDRWQHLIFEQNLKLLGIRK